MRHSAVAKRTRISMIRFGSAPASATGLHTRERCRRGPTPGGPPDRPRRSAATPGPRPFGPPHVRAGTGRAGGGTRFGRAGASGPRRASRALGLRALAGQGGAGAVRGGAAGPASPGRFPSGQPGGTGHFRWGGAGAGEGGGKLPPPIPLQCRWRQLKVSCWSLGRAVRFRDKKGVVGRG